MKAAAWALLACLLWGGTPGCAPAGRGEIVVATTTSVYDSGLLDELVRAFRRESGITARVVAVGTGQALELGRRGDADALLVHDPPAEEDFLTSGHGLSRTPVMENGYLLVGPPADPAGVSGATSAREAFARIAAAKSPFLSRGDSSGTHAAEKRVWREAGLTPGGSWYLEAGQGMGETLTMAGEIGAYTLADAATFTSRRASVNLVALYDGGRELSNVYSVIVVNPRLRPHGRAEGARQFAAFLASPAGRTIISAFGREKFGAPLFRPVGD